MEAVITFSSLIENTTLPLYFAGMKKRFEQFMEYYPWFTDIWYYLLFIVLFIILAFIYL